MPPLQLLLLSRADRTQVRQLQAVLEAAPAYHINTGGSPACASEAESTLGALPPDFPRENKFTFAIVRAGSLIGCVDLLRGYPEPHQAMLGLLLLREDAQGKGAGRTSFRAVEAIVQGWPEINAIRIGVVEANANVLGFWQKMGFRDTGLRRPFKNGPIRSLTMVLEKSLPSDPNEP
ncbi:MAG: GNAT family N-acetyltransferase [Proteobacteria bacterium]|nr:MAG: GNAT family N-acetyltransferase [Pseudomonadota bacterium]